MSDNIGSARLRLRRAWKHIKEFEAEAIAFRESHPYSVVPEQDEQPDEYAYRVLVRQWPPQTLGLIVGDAIHSFRSILDNLVWQEGQRFGERPESQLGFPICFTPKAFEDRSPDLQRLPDDVLTWIEDLQPYTRGDKADTHPLYVMNRLAVEDKHRAIPIMAAILKRSTWQTGDTAAKVWLTSGGFDDGSIIARAKRTGGSELHIETYFVFDIVLKGFGPPFIPIWDFLINLHKFVGDEVIAPFAEILERRERH